MGEEFKYQFEIGGGGISPFLEILGSFWLVSEASSSVFCDFSDQLF